MWCDGGADFRVLTLLDALVGDGAGVVKEGSTLGGELLVGSHTSMRRTWSKVWFLKDDMSAWANDVVKYGWLRDCSGKSCRKV